MNFATWSLRNPVAVLLLFFLMSLAGIKSFMQLPVQDLPDLDLPTVNISLSEPGAAPKQLQDEVARKAEASLSTIALLRHLKTSITEGQVQIVAEFRYEKSLSDALAESKDAIDRIITDLPADIDPPVISAVRVGNNPILTYALDSQKMSEEDLTWFVDDVVQRQTQILEGVGKFERIGGLDREIQLELNPAKLSEFGTSAAEISRTLRLSLMQYPGGKGEIEGTRLAIRTANSVYQAGDLRRFPVLLANGRTVTLDQLGTLVDGTADRTQAAILNGHRVVGFRIYRAKGFDETKVAAEVTRVLANIRSQHPDLKATVVASRVPHTQEQYQASMHMLYEGAILAVLIIALWLRNFRATLIAAVSLPMALLPTFVALDWLGYTLNTLTLLALSVVIGILVDDVIVEIENIERHMHQGKPPKQATADAVSEIALVVVATTMSLVAVFLPTAGMAGLGGMFFRQFAWTAVVAVVSSLLVARLFVPVLASALLKVPAKHTEGSPLTDRYLRFVRICLEHRGRTVLVSLLFLVGSFSLFPLLETGFLPSSDRGYTTVNFELTAGSTIESSAAIGSKIQRATALIPGVRGLFVLVGGGAQGGASNTQGSNDRKGIVTLALAPSRERPPLKEVERRINEAMRAIPGIRFATGADQVELTLTSETPDILLASAKQLAVEMRDVPGISNVMSSADLQRPELVVRPDWNKAALLGVTATSIGEAIRVSTVGDIDRQLAKINAEARQIPIRVRLDKRARMQPDIAERLEVQTATGKFIPLANVANIEYASGIAQIDRYDRQQYIQIKADRSAPLGQVLARIRQLPAFASMPATIHPLETGDAELMHELIDGFGTALMIGVLCIFCVLVLLFKDLLQPITILSAIPFSVGGALLALLFFGSELDVISMIGLVMLMGIVTKNSILIVEYAVENMRQRKMKRNEALIDACAKRVRPVIMTTAAMAAGMLPIAAGIGNDAAFHQPMALAVIGGLLTSTLLSLILVPTVFSLLDDFKQRFLAFLSGKRSH